YRPADGPWVGVVGNDPAIACIVADSHLAAQLSPEILLNDVTSTRLLSGLRRRDVSGCVELFKWPWELVRANPNWLREDYDSYRWDGAIQGRVSIGAHLLGQ